MGPPEEAAVELLEFVARRACRLVDVRLAHRREAVDREILAWRITMSHETHRAHVHPGRVVTVEPIVVRPGVEVVTLEALVRADAHEVIGCAGDHAAQILPLVLAIGVSGREVVAPAGRGNIVLCETEGGLTVIGADELAGHPRIDPVDEKLERKSAARKDAQARTAGDVRPFLALVIEARTPHGETQATGHVGDPWGPKRRAAIHAQRSERGRDIAATFPRFPACLHLEISDHPLLPSDFRFHEAHRHHRQRPDGASDEPPPVHALLVHPRAGVRGHGTRGRSVVASSLSPVSASVRRPGSACFL